MQFLNDLINADWVVWFLIIIFAMFILWLFVGGGDYDYIGLEPMKVGVDSNKFIDGETVCRVERSNYNAPKYVAVESETQKETPEVICKPGKRCSNGEAKCREVLENKFGKLFPTVRPNFLKNPETKRNLELDCYNDELKLAIEYNGSQHYEFPNTFHRTKEDFIKQVRRDQYKVERCNQEGIYLITVPHTVPLNEIESYIDKQLEGYYNLDYDYCSEGYSDEEYEISFV